MFGKIIGILIIIACVVFIGWNGYSIYKKIKEKKENNKKE